MKVAKYVSVILLTAVSTLSPVASHAADQNPDVPRRPRPQDDFRDERRPGPPNDRMAGVQPRMGGLPFEAVLNEDQRAEFREEMQTHREHLRELEQKAARLRREYNEALFAEELDEKLVREKSVALAEIDVERALIRAKAFAKIRPSLSDVQLERLKNLRVDLQQNMRPQPGDFRGPREGEGQFDNRPDRPRRPRPPEDDDRGTGLPPPAPPRPPPAPAPK